MPVLESVQEFFDGTILKGVHRYDLAVGEDDTDWDSDVIGITVVE
jgi:hypothetical protein